MSDDQRQLFDGLAPTIGELEAWCVGQGYRVIIGVDEAGRGPLAGPVHAAAVALRLDELDAGWIAQLDDSKKLDEAARLAAYDEIQARAPAFAIASCDQRTIDDINILQATHQAMATAVAEVIAALDCEPDYVFIDGNMPVKTLTCRQRAVVKGDARSYGIAAASILAKVSRDRMMVACHERWPEYNFASNKGYPTGEHRRAIAAHGPCSIHRMSFRGVAEHVDRLRSD